MRAAVYDRLGSAELARAAGADAVVDYRAEDAASAVRAAAPDGVDRIVEVALGANLELDLRVLAQNGTVVTYAQTGPDPAIRRSRCPRSTGEIVDGPRVQFSGSVGLTEIEPIAQPLNRRVEVACGEDGSALIAESVLGGLCHATVGTPAPRKTSRTSGFRVMLIAAHLARRSQRVDLATARRTWWSPPEALA